MTDLYREPDIISGNIKGRLRCLGHEERMSAVGTLKKVFKTIPDGNTSVGKPRKIWLDDV